MLEGIRGLLECMFDTVVMVADESSLIEAVTKIKPDLVVADLSLPASEEVNIARSLKKDNPGLKFIILSVHDEMAIVDECLAAGAEGFVLKRSAVSDLIPAVEEVLGGGTYVSPSTKH